MSFSPNVSKSYRTLRSSRGFTLPEVLLSGVLGAMLLSALAYATAEFAIGVTHMEKKAGISSGEDMVLRRMTRDIREAWWADLPSTTSVRLSDPNGNLTQYYLEDGELKVQMPNGDIGVLLTDVTSLGFEAGETQRLREAAPTLWNGALYTRAIPGNSALPLEVPQGGQIALAFQSPVEDDELPGGGVDGDEVLRAMSITLLSTQLAWQAGSAGDEALKISVYESWAPGSARPLGTSMGSVEIPGVALPIANWNDSAWDVPVGDTTLSVTGIAQSLTPGVGYTVVLEAEGDAKLIMAAHPEVPDSDRDDVALKSVAGGSFVNLPLAIPFTVSGPHTISSSSPTDVVSTISVSLNVSNQAVQTRSATLLGQAVSDDPWSGVIPGEAAP